MLLPYQAVVANGGVSNAAPIDKQFIVRFASGIEDEDPNDVFCAYFGGQTSAAGTLDASVSNMPIQTSPALAHALGAPIAAMTQIAAPGSADELKFCEFTGGRIRVRANTTLGAGLAVVSIALMGNRPFTVTEIP